MTEAGKYITRYQQSRGEGGKWAIAQGFRKKGPPKKYYGLAAFLQL